MNKILKILISVILIIIVGSTIYKLLNMNINSKDIQAYVSSFGKLAPLVYIIMFALVPLTLFPDSVLAIGGGLIFGLFKGYIYTLIGALIGASLSFYISRKLGRNFVKKLTKEKLDGIESMINSKGFFVVLMLRLIPLFPFDIISYGAGLTSIKYKDFLLATIIGTIPGILVFTNIGAQSVNIGSNGFYMSIMALILLVIASIFLKNKFVSFYKK
ncbi:TVP38/TMEM64 family protein [Paeniclostridium sp. NSJ-45]|uniref:TVP38/TMEM64 family membrane protein n=1 Tax=Paeniclostridium hominis TaxID=2764329 RepID=A0ABR7K3S7_9FIRM|nr:TVP38/TMEM64 family protein [Paeniclostridium hominis]